MRAFLNLRYAVPERHNAFTIGLSRLGYEVHRGVTNKPEHGDILVTWNRIGTGQKAALDFEHAGCKVIVTENASWGNDFRGERWYHIALGRHNTKGMYPVGDSSRWDSLCVDLPPFRGEGESLILPQRGIGSPPTAMPLSWTKTAQKRHGCRVRWHPGTRTTTTLEKDLEGIKTVITWGSGAAIKALMMGCHVISDMPDWIGYQDNTEADRLRMFRELAWAQWTLGEIAEGTPFARLIHWPGN